MTRSRLVRALLLASGTLAPAGAAADTLYLQGRMAGRITLEVTERYDPAPGTNWISLKSHRTPSFGSPTWRQTVVSDEAVYALRPGQAAVEADEHGNLVLTERWEQPTATVEIVRRLVVETEARLGPVQSQAVFPLGAMPPATARFLRPSPMVQREDPAIQALAARLTAGARTEWQAVTAILNHVVDHLQYQYDPPRHDALFALENRVVNCQGYAHLSLALLRAAGIPARVAAGISLSKGWRVQHGSATLVMKVGQGRHAWIEVFYPDLGWIPYDPQTSQLFVSLYHVRQAVGLDVQDVVGTIQASPVLPGMRERIDGDGSDETFGLSTASQARTPRNYVVSSVVREASVAATPPPAPPPARPPALPVNRQDLTQLVEFGNTEFPAALRIFGAAETTGVAGVMQARRTYVVETADYATGREELAQAFAVTESLLLTQVSLALQKFGGQTGELWIELLDNQGRRPGGRLAESRRLAVSALVERGGYRWVVFDIASHEGGRVLSPGRYWMVLRSSGDGIFNWYFSLGSAHGDPDDTRSRLRGSADWPNILNYRFNFRITGLAKP